MKKWYRAFTLAEILVTLTILGIVAAITIPSTLKQHTKTTNKTKLKKAMTVYDSALNKIMIENNLRGDVSIQTWKGENCDNLENYFKAYDRRNCTFRTADGIYWNFDDITHPLMSLERIKPDNGNGKGNTLSQTKAMAEDMDNKKAFYMVGRFDSNGSLRVNDLGFEKIQENNVKNIAYVSKLYSVVNNDLSIISDMLKSDLAWLNTISKINDNSLFRPCTDVIKTDCVRTELSNDGDNENTVHIIGSDGSEIGSGARCPVNSLKGCSDGFSISREKAVSKTITFNGNSYDIAKEIEIKSNSGGWYDGNWVNSTDKIFEDKDGNQVYNLVTNEYGTTCYSRYEGLCNSIGY